MATHNYYCKVNKDGINWNTDNFIKVIENSTGSNKGDDTSELVLGDRFFYNDKDKEDNQKEFDFVSQFTNQFNMEKFTDVGFLK
jgi:hypothetical protein